MFETFKKETTLVRKVTRFFDGKRRNRTNKRKLRRLLKREIVWLEIIMQKSKKKDKHLLNLVGHDIHSEREATLLEQLGRLNRSQMDILIDGLETELLDIRQRIATLINLLRAQLIALDTNEFDNLLNKEGDMLAQLKVRVTAEQGIQKKMKNALNLVEKLEHSRTFMSIIKGLSKVFAWHNGISSIVVTGKENVPPTGPVLIAPRHFDGENDPSLFYNTVQRRIFFLGATDWMKEGIQLTLGKYAFKKLGVVPVNRPDSIFQRPTKGLLSAYKGIVRLLMLNQAVVVFPEGWPNIDPNWTVKKEGSQEIIQAKAGIFHFVDYVQKKRRIEVPIIPVGTRFEKVGKKTIVYMKYGNPIFLPVSNNIIDYSSYQRKVTIAIKTLSKAA